MSLRIVLIAQDPDILRVFEEVASGQPFELAHYTSVEDGIRAATEPGCSLAFVSLDASADDGTGALAQIRTQEKNLPVYLLAAPDASLPVDSHLWFEVLRTPVRKDALRWILDAVLHHQPSRLFKLYVSGRGPYARACSERVQGMLESAVRGGYELEVIDILREPNRARLDHVRATPTLVRVGPTPRQQVVGVDEARIERVWDPADVRW